MKPASKGNLAAHVGARSRRAWRVMAAMAHRVARSGVSAKHGVKIGGRQRNAFAAARRRLALAPWQ